MTNSLSAGTLQGLFCVLLFIAMSRLEAIYDQSTIFNILQEPNSTRAALKSTVVLTCRVRIVADSKLHWVKGDFVIGSSNDEIKNYDSRYELVYGTDSNFLTNGIYDLKLNNISYKDDDKFRCQMTVPNLPPARSKEAHIYVLIASEKPFMRQLKPPMSINNVINNKNAAWTEIGKELQVICVARYGRPGAQLFWFYDDIPLHPDSQGKVTMGTMSMWIKYDVQADKDNKPLKHAVSVLSMNASREQQHKKVSCEARNEGYDDIRFITHTSLELRSKPMVNISIDPHLDSQHYFENQLITIRCIAEGSPNTFYWQWVRIINNISTAINNVAEPFYQVKVTRSMHGTLFRCIAMNFAQGFADVILSVIYSPKFVLDESDVLAADEYSTITLQCTVDSNPPSMITWRRQGSAAIITHSKYLVIPQVFPADYGVYVCTAKHPHYPEINRNFYLQPKAAPVISMLKRMYSYLDSLVEIVCEIESAPLVNITSISWQKNAEEIMVNTRVFTNNMKRGKKIVSILRINDVEEKDFGSYNCSAANTIGAAFNITELILKDEIPIALISGASITVALVLFFLVVMVVICKRGIKQRQITDNMKESGVQRCINCKCSTELIRPPTHTTLVNSPDTASGSSRSPAHSISIHHMWEQPFIHSYASYNEHIDNRNSPQAHQSTWLRHNNNLHHAVRILEHSPLGDNVIHKSTVPVEHVLLKDNHHGSVPVMIYHDMLVKHQCDDNVKLEETDTYNEDSSKSYDSGFSPGQGGYVSNYVMTSSVPCPHSSIHTNNQLPRPSTTIWNTHI